MCKGVYEESRHQIIEMEKKEQEEDTNEYHFV